MIHPFVRLTCSSEPSRRRAERGRNKGLPEDTVQGRMTADAEAEDYRTERRICRKDSRWREELPLSVVARLRPLRQLMALRAVERKVGYRQSPTQKTDAACRVGKA